MSFLPDILRTRLADALVWVERDGYVPIWHRQAIYAALGPPQPRVPIDGDQVSLAERRRLEQTQRDRGGIPVWRFQKAFGANRTRGHLRRTALAIATVGYDFVIWDDPRWYKQRTRDVIQRIMTLVQRVYAGQTPDAMDLDGLLISTFDAFHSEDFVWVAAGQAYNVAVWDSDLELDPLPPFRSDTELRAFWHDVAGLAVIAAEHRYAEFWAWWLTSAVPQAWAAHPD